MSYINDALKKAQKSKNKGYEDYSDIIQTPSMIKNLNPVKKWVIGIAVSLLFLTFTALLLYYYTDKNSTNVRLPALQEARRPAVLPDQSFAQEQTAQQNAKAPVLDTGADAAKLYQEALALQRKGRFTEAGSLYEQTLALDPTHVQALNNLGVVFMSRRKNAEAIVVFRKAIRINKDYADPYYNFACLHSKWGNIDPALRYLKKAAALNPEVLEWAKNDKDLNYLHTSVEFKRLIGKQED